MRTPARLWVVSVALLGGASSLAADAGAIPLGNSDDLPSHHALPPVGARYRSVREVPWRRMRYQGAWRHPERWAEHLRENVVRVRNGRFVERGGDYSFEVRSVTFGDVDGDGTDEAAVVTFEAMGREYIEQIWVYGVRSRRLQRIGTIGPPIEDVERAYVDSIAITGGRIVMRRSLLGVHDPSCCPGRSSDERWQIVEGEPVLERIVTRPVTID